MDSSNLVVLFQRLASLRRRKAAVLKRKRVARQRRLKLARKRAQQLLLVVIMSTMSMVCVIMPRGVAARGIR